MANAQHKGRHVAAFARTAALVTSRTSSQSTCRERRSNARAPWSSGHEQSWSACLPRRDCPSHDAQRQCDATWLLLRGARLPSYAIPAACSISFLAGVPGARGILCRHRLALHPAGNVNSRQQNRLRGRLSIHSCKASSYDLSRPTPTSRIASMLAITVCTWTAAAFASSELRLFGSPVEIVPWSAMPG